MNVEQGASFDEAWELYRTPPDRAVQNAAEEPIAYGRTFQSFADYATGITKKAVKHPAAGIRAVTPELCEEYANVSGQNRPRVEAPHARRRQTAGSGVQRHTPTSAGKY